MKERRVERLEDNIWCEIPFKELREGDTFRLFDPGPDPIETGTTRHALTDARLNDDGIYFVEVDLSTIDYSKPVVLNLS